MVPGTHAEFPTDVSLVENMAGFSLTAIYNPHPKGTGAAEVIYAVVCPIDENNRVLKRLSLAGVVSYQHRRRPALPSYTDASAGIWANVFAALHDAARAVSVAKHNRNKPDLAVAPG